MPEKLVYIAGKRYKPNIKTLSELPCVLSVALCPAWRSNVPSYWYELYADFVGIYFYVYSQWNFIKNKEKIPITNGKIVSASFTNLDKAISCVEFSTINKIRKDNFNCYSIDKFVDNIEEYELDILETRGFSENLSKLEKNIISFCKEKGFPGKDYLFESEFNRILKKRETESKW